MTTTLATPKHNTPKHPRNLPIVKLLADGTIVEPSANGNGKVDPSKLPVGTELGDGLRVGHGGVITGSVVITKDRARKTRAALKKTTLARSNELDYGHERMITTILCSPGNPRHAEVVARVKEMKPELREKFCPRGYVGKSRELFIQRGLLVGEVIEMARKAREERDRQHAKEEQAKAKTETKAAKPKKERKPKAERPTGATPADIAEQIDGAAPRDVRVFLRKHAEQFPKVDGFYAFDAKQVKAIVTGVKKELEK